MLIKNTLLLLLTVYLLTILLSFLLEFIAEKNYYHSLKKYFPLLYCSLGKLWWVDFTMNEHFWKMLIPFYNLYIAGLYFKIYFIDSIKLFRSEPFDKWLEDFTMLNFAIVLGMTDIYTAYEDLDVDTLKEINKNTSSFCLDFYDAYKNYYDLSSIEELIKEEENKLKNLEEYKDLEQ